MKKLFSLIFLLTYIFCPLWSFAATQTINVKLVDAVKSTQSKWDWRFDIDTTNIPENTEITITINDSKNATVKTDKKKIKDNYLYYTTGFVLNDKEQYTLLFIISPQVKKAYVNTAGGTNILANIVNFTPKQGRPGNTVTLTGDNLDTVKRVLFGEVESSHITHDSSKQLRAEVPVGAQSGKIKVVNNNGTAESQESFTLLVDEPVNVTGQKDTSSPNGVYQLLAPIGNLICFGDAPGCVKDNIGEYFNVIFKIAIGLCGALAVIMIVIGGVQYMGNESVFGKTEAKGKITSAILGLIIALGSYALLNTINPDLLGGGGVNIQQVSAEIEEETEPLTKNDAFTPGQKTDKCSSGIVFASTANGNIPVCSTLKTNVENLVSDAKKAGNNIFGYGYRSKKKQEELRSQNCGGAANIYNASAICKPLTAYPGKSMHENGFAIDFTCDEATIKSRNNKCFIWLKNNASKYGLKNLQKEPWHWSTTGN